MELKALIFSNELKHHIFVISFSGLEDFVLYLSQVKDIWRFKD